MSIQLKLFLIACGLVFSVIVFRMLLKKKISERNSIIWMTGVAAILVISANPLLVDLVSLKLGIQYPPALVFLITSMILLILVLQLSIQVSVMNEKIRELAQQVAINQLRQDEKPFIYERMESYLESAAVKENSDD